MNKLLKKFDAALNNITSYRLLAYDLTLIAIISSILSSAGLLSLSPVGLLVSFGLLVIGCYFANRLFSKVWDAPTNSESWYISALILFFILPPPTTLEAAIFVFFAGIIAMASKFIIARRFKHIFNPAAFGAAAIGLTGLLNTTWWVGSEVLWPLTLIFGILIVRKIHRYHLVIAFGATAIIVSLVSSVAGGQDNLDTLKILITASPLIFLGTVMLTDPATMPPRRKQQIVYGALVGGLFAWHPTIGSLYVYPETALLVGNLFVFFISHQYRLQLRLKRIEKISDHVLNYVFSADKKFEFQAGQYLEWTLPHKKVDGRGNRRLFSISSSPTENEIHFGFKTYERSSSYKKALLNMMPGDKIYASQLAGDFILPKDYDKKLVFIAGGIGITPFRSMIKNLIDTKQTRDIILYYMVSNLSEIAYKEILEQAQSIGVKVIFVYSKRDPTKVSNYPEKLDDSLIKQTAPDFSERLFYISGPDAMVKNYKHLLKKLSVSSRQIKTDHFTGY